MAKTEELAVSSGELALIDTAIVISPDISTEDLGLIRDVLTGQAEYEVPEADASAISADILNRLLFAGSEEELLADMPTWSSKENVGRDFRVLPAGRLWPSSYTNAKTGRKGAFLSIQAVDVETGEVGVLNTSSPYIVGKFAWYAKNGGLPGVFRIVARGESSGGFPILDVDKVD